MVFHPLLNFISQDSPLLDSFPTYWYEGICPQTGNLLRLPRTVAAEAIARTLMQQIASDESYAREGKMYGILLVETPTGERGFLKAFSGLLNGNSTIEGWVPTMPGREEIALAEARTLAILEAIKQQLIALQDIPERQQYEILSSELEAHYQQLKELHTQRKQSRQKQRQDIDNILTEKALKIALEELNEESRRDGIERRHFKQKRQEILQPLKNAIAQADTQIRQLKQQRKELSRQLQSQMYAAYCLTNFSGESVSLQQLMLNGFLPTGTGDCCAPKLLDYAAIHGFKPLAMAEFWWGNSSAKGDKTAGEFYGACAERCQPIMGFLLSGLPQKNANTEIKLCEGVPLIIYEDKWLIAVNKPAGLLSVPGRYSCNQDSVVNRLRQQILEGMKLAAVHRLDGETSGILVLARDEETYRQLSKQFQQRQVYKIYEAVLGGRVTVESSAIALPLWGDPAERPRQQVNWQLGKPSITRFRIMEQSGEYTRMEFCPVTGRTHQIRVHAADPNGLGIPILGDRLYGCRCAVKRLHLHARELKFEHPYTKETVHLMTKTPF